MKPILALVTLATGILAAAPLLRRDDPDSISDNYIVVMKKGLENQAIQAHFDLVRSDLSNLPGGKRGFVREYHIEEFNAYHVECDETTLQDIQNHELVDYVSHDVLVRTQRATPPAPGPAGHVIPDAYVSSWGLGRISHRLANDTRYAGVALPLGGQPSTAYVIDTGVRITHREFGGRAIQGPTFIDDCSDDDEDGHGTHVAGTIMGATTGVDNTTLAISLKFIQDGLGPGSGMIAALDWAVQHARNASNITRSVVNLSCGSGFDEASNDAINAAVAAGMTVVVAAGNDWVDACNGSPASAPSAITAGAIDSLDNRAYNYGPCVDMFAPGVNILSSFHGDDQDYATLSGTSMAAPHIAGLAAYLMAREDLTTPEAVWNRIKELATPDQVIDAKDGSPNLIAFNGNPAELNT
ncbi:subtilisin-like protease [Xylariaceae sp. AK1471]|nr:subtilisin-like protease [Xylariaceae sp. AK1471]